MGLRGRVREEFMSRVPIVIVVAAHPSVRRDSAHTSAGGCWGDWGGGVVGSTRRRDVGTGQSPYGRGNPGRRDACPSSGGTARGEISTGDCERVNRCK